MKRNTMLTAVRKIAAKRMRALLLPPRHSLIHCQSSVYSRHVYIISKTGHLFF